MVVKKIGIYNENTIPGSSHQLVIEIGNDELMCLSKNLITLEVIAFELFAIEKEDNINWNKILYAFKTTSEILKYKYKEVKCFFNLDELVLIPEEMQGESAAEDYLNLIYGENNKQLLCYENVTYANHFISAYRVPKIIIDNIHQTFENCQLGHTYSVILKDVMGRTDLHSFFLKIQFYTTHFVLGVWKLGKLQIIQSYKYFQPEDVIYYLLRIVQQFEMDALQTELELSGMIEEDADIYVKLLKIFGKIKNQHMLPNGIFQNVSAKHPAYYFSPFYNLSL
jgi:hypothetical protein